ncbi:MAG: hypothetical protein WCY77_09680 [Weeksellaceae bacterium]|jgi:hypothetical protein
MVKPTKSRIQIFASLLFLLLMLAKPMHQLSHLIHQDNHHNEIELGDLNKNHEDSCTLCVFNFSPTLENSLPLFVIELQVELISKEINSEPQFLPPNFSITYKQLRAPPTIG